MAKCLLLVLQLGFDDKFNAPYESEKIVGVLIDNQPSSRRRFMKYIPNFPHLAKDISSASVIEEL